MTGAVWITVDLIGAVSSLVSAVCVVTGASVSEVELSVCWTAVLVIGVTIVVGDFVKVWEAVGVLIYVESRSFFSMYGRESEDRPS